MKYINKLLTFLYRNSWTGLREQEIADQSYQKGYERGYKDAIMGLKK